MELRNVRWRNMCDYSTIVENFKMIEDEGLIKACNDPGAESKCFGGWITKILRERHGTAPDLFTMYPHSWGVMVQYFHPREYWWNENLRNMSEQFDEDVSSFEIVPKWKDLSKKKKNKYRKMSTGEGGGRCDESNLAKTFYKTARRIQKILVKHGAPYAIAGISDWDVPASVVMERAESDFRKLKNGEFDII